MASTISHLYLLIGPHCIPAVPPLFLSGQCCKCAFDVLECNLFSNTTSESEPGSCHSITHKLHTSFKAVKTDKSQIGLGLPK